METAGSEFQPEPWQAVEPGQVIPGLPPGLTRERARVWALVLDARGVPCCLVQPLATRWELHVPPEYLARACAEIAAFEEKNRNWPPLPPLPRPMVENSLSTLSVLLLLATFHNIVRLDLILPGGVSADWFGGGSAQAAAILHGEWWRTITSLTLHRDVAHLLGNLAIGGVFVLLLCREIGSGLAWCLILAAGGFGNLANSLLQPGWHNSVGASTAVFGTVGILASLSMVRYWHQLQKRWGLPVAAAMTLLTVLGTEGKNTDLGAHLFGFGSGLLLGLLTELVVSRRGHPGAVLNALLALWASLLVIVAWLAAIAAG